MVESRLSYNGLQKTNERDIQDILEMHLKRRSVDSSVSDEDQKERRGLGHSRQDKKIIETKRADDNLVSYTSISTDANPHEEQYLSLKSFLAACNGTYRTELVQLLFPVFSVFVVEQISMEHLNAAQTFFGKYYAEHEEKNKKEIEQLRQLIKTRDFASDKSKLTEWRQNKFNVVFSSKVFTYLMQHLRNNDHSLLLQTINRNIDIRTSDATKHEESNEWIATDIKEDNDAEMDDEEVRKLKDAIQKVAEASKTKPSVTLYSFVNAYQGLSAVKFSPNNNVICAGFEDSSIRLWSLNMKKLGLPNAKVGSQKSGTASTEASPNESIVLRGHRGPVYAVQFLPEGNAVLSASEDCSVRLWSVQSQTSMVEYKGHDYPVWDISTGCKGSYFVSASKDHTIRLWASEYAYPLRIFAGHVNSVDCVQFHPNGNFVASGSSDRTCRLWDLQSAQFVRVFVGHEAPIYAAAFSPDGTHLVSAGDDNRVLVWDIRTGKILKDLRGHTDTLYSLAFSKDGSMLVSGGLDNSIRVWNAEAILKHGTEGLSTSDSMYHLISAYSTKATSVLELSFAQGNLLLAAGLHETR